MDFESKLISVYLYIDALYNNELFAYCKRFSNHDKPVFTDVEALTLYVFGLIMKRRQLKEIHCFGDLFLRQFFPELPSYTSFVRRMNYLSPVLPRLAERLSESLSKARSSNVQIIDSYPIILAKHRRSDTAKVARGFAEKSYCATKQLYYHGFKLHVLARQTPGTLPVIEFVSLTSAKTHDLKPLESFLPYLQSGVIVADRAYSSKPHRQRMRQEKQIQLHTPIKFGRGKVRPLTLFEKLYSTSVSRVRQPIESFFHWINEKTAIQDASKVRSYKGALTHVFGRLAAAMFIMVFNM